MRSILEKLIELNKSYVAHLEISPQIHASEIPLTESPHLLRIASPFINRILRHQEVSFALPFLTRISIIRYHSKQFIFLP